MTDTEHAQQDPHTQVISILEFAGLHRCEHVSDRPVYCGCSPGRCQQREIDERERG